MGNIRFIINDFQLSSLVLELVTRFGIDSVVSFRSSLNGRHLRALPVFFLSFGLSTLSQQIFGFYNTSAVLWGGGVSVVKHGGATTK